MCLWLEVISGSSYFAILISPFKLCFFSMMLQSAKITPFFFFVNQNVAAKKLKMQGSLFGFFDSFMKLKKPIFE